MHTQRGLSGGRAQSRGCGQTWLVQEYRDGVGRSGKGVDTLESQQG